MIVAPVAMADAWPIDAAVEPALAHALADELVALTTLLGDLAFDLADNPATLRHHMHSLQGIDRITQAQLAIADVLRSSAPVDRRLEAVTLEELGATIRESVCRYRRDGVATGSDTDDAA